MKILVTGGAGFIGSHLTDYLLSKNHDVIVVDNFFTGSENNLAGQADNPHLTIIKQDIISPFNAGPVDQIYNLACPASPIHYVKDPIETVKTNVLGTINMLEYARKYRAVFLQTSTSEVYGDPAVHPQKEDYWGNVNPIGPRSCYDEGKRCAETLCYNYREKYGLNAKIVRIFNTYGPRMQFEDGRALPNFIKQALKGETLTVAGDGSQTRSLMYIDDLILGLTAMVQEDGFFGPVNLGNPEEELTIKKLAEEVIASCGSTSTIGYYPLPVDDPLKRKPDISLAKERLNWLPKVSLSEGLKKTIIDFKTRLNIHV